MEKKIWNKDLIENAFLLSEGTNINRVYLTKDKQVLKIISDTSLLDEEFVFGVQECIDNKSPLTLNASSFSEYMDLFSLQQEQKILYADHFKGISGINLPHTMYYDKSGKYVGCAQNYIAGFSLQDVSFLLDKKEQCEKLIELSHIIETINKEGICVPDISNLCNILLTHDKLDVVLIDYDDFQIKDFLTPIVTESLSLLCNPLFDHSKYYNKETWIYTSNIDKAGLLHNVYMILCNNMLLGTNYAEEYQRLLLKDKNTISFEDDYVEYMLDISEFRNTELEDATRLVFNQEKDNIYPEKGLKEYIKKLDL